MHTLVFGPQGTAEVIRTLRPSVVVDLSYLDTAYTPRFTIGVRGGAVFFLTPKCTSATMAAVVRACVTGCDRPTVYTFGTRCPQAVVQLVLEHVRSVDAVVVVGDGAVASEMARLGHDLLFLSGEGSYALGAMAPVAGRTPSSTEALDPSRLFVHRQVPLAPWSALPLGYTRLVKETVKTEPMQDVVLRPRGVYGLSFTASFVAPIIGVVRYIGSKTFTVESLLVPPSALEPYRLGAAHKPETAALYLLDLYQYQ
jgi:hypothetical protein